jgi:hypothetical protein
LGCDFQGGAVFRLSPTGSLTTLFVFQCTDVFALSCNDGTLDAGGLVVAGDGNLYGTSTAYSGGDSVAFMLTIAGDLTEIHRWSSFDGIPASPLTVGINGRLYGTGRATTGSGSFVYSMSTSGALTSLDTVSPAIPLENPSPLTEGQPGIFYSTADRSGPSAHGFVYRLNTNH